MRQNKFILGLTGSIGTGKSYACRFFEKKSCRILDADKIAKSLYEKDSDVLLKLAKTFGTNILNFDGTLNKQELAKIVFNDKRSLNKLNEVLKISLKLEIDRLIDNISLKEAKPFIVLEAPVLFEYGFEYYVDFILLITADEDVIIKRVMKRDNLSRKESMSRYKSQMSQEKKKKLSDIWIDNSNDFKEFENSLEQAYCKILKNIV